MCTCIRTYVRTFVCIYICTYMCKHVCAWIVLLVEKLVQLGHSTGVSSWDCYGQKELVSPNLSEAASVRLPLSFCVMPYAVKLFENCLQYVLWWHGPKETLASGREWVLGLLVPLFHGKRWHNPWVANAKECSQYTISSLDYSTRSWWYPLALDVVVLVL